MDLANLLPENLQELQFDQAKDSKAKEESKKKKATIASTLDWSVAFTTFMAVSAHCQPERAITLAAYFSIVLNLVRDIGGQAWSRYDRLFRQAASVSSSLPWHHWEPDIWLMAIPGVACSRQPGLPASRPCLRQSGRHPAATRQISAVAGIRGGATSQNASITTCALCVRASISLAPAHS